MVELAHACKNLDVFTHVSTAYVNSYKHGTFSEEIVYEDGEIDCEKQVE